MALGTPVVVKMTWQGFINRWFGWLLDWREGR